MQVSGAIKDGVQVIALSGKLDGTTSPQAQEEILASLGAASQVVIDMSRCSFVSSAGLRVLLNLAKTLARNSGQGVLAGLVTEVADVMKITGFGNVFPCYADVDTAIAALKKRK
jgi:anti-anti-sigma factor